MNRLRIAYVCHWNAFVEDGVVRKIGAQVRVWRSLGAEVEVFCVSRAPVSPGPPKLGGMTFSYRRPLVGRFRATRALARTTLRWQPDVVYLRYSLFFPPPVALVRRIPTAVEINGHDRRQYRSRGRRVTLYNELNRSLILSNAAGLVFVSEELASLPDFTRWRKPAVVVADGIDLAVAAPLPPANNDRPRVVLLVGSPGPWHGVDKMIWLARALPEMDFELVGVDPGSVGHPPPNLTTHPFLSRRDYEPILRRSDVALGTLALHRNEISEAPTAKVREYLLYGLPVIIAYDDPDLRDPLWFVLRLPNTESNVRDHLEKIRQYVADVAGRRVPRALVADRINIAVKEPHRLRFLDEVGARLNQSRKT